MYNYIVMTRTYYRLLLAPIIVAAIILACLLAPDIALAEGDGSPIPYGDYMVNADAALSLYKNDANAPSELIQAPRTYIVTYSRYDATLYTLGYFAVNYGGEEYYVKINDMQSLCTRYDSSRYGALSDIAGVKTSYSIAASDLFSGDSKNDISVYQATHTAGKISAMSPDSRVTINSPEIDSVKGMVTVSGATYYRIHATVSVFGQNISVDGYISAADVTDPLFKSMSIGSAPVNDKLTAHIAAKDEELNNKPAVKPTPNPGDENNGGDKQSTSNNLERIVLSIIIGVLCVAVVILIFRPGRKKKNS